MSGLQITGSTLLGYALNFLQFLVFVHYRLIQLNGLVRIQVHRTVLQHIIGYMWLFPYREYSYSWKQYGAHSYCYRHHTDFGDYSFIAIDAHPVPGPRLPYNFFGVLSEV